MKIISILILVFTYACSDADKSYFRRSDLDIPNLTNENIPADSSYLTSTPVYITSPSGEVIEARIFNLYKIFTVKYSTEYDEFSDFIHAALNQEIQFDPADPAISHLYTQSFRLDDSVSMLYQRGIDSLITRYFTRIENGDYLIHQPVVIPILNSVSYFMFLNKYWRQEDDNNATIEFREMKRVVN